MSLRFRALVEPSAEVIDSVSATTPRSPFNSSAFAAAARSTGARPCVVALYDSNGTIGGAVALLSGDVLNRELTVPTAPAVAAPELFWSGVAEFCRTQRVCDLHIDTYASDGDGLVELPDRLRAPGAPAISAHSVTRWRRFEYVLDLSERFPTSELSKHHRRAIRRAGKAHLRIARSSTADDAATHLGAMRSSMIRRKRRGEAVLVPRNVAFHRALLEYGAADLFQAWAGDEVVASILVLKTETCAYYQSAGTTAAGMQTGASPFLVVEAMNLLAADGVRWFNLGGAGPEAPGLHRFKTGFGAREVQLESASYSLIGGYSRAVRRLARLVKRAPRQLLQAAGPARRSHR